MEDQESARMEVDKGMKKLNIDFKELKCITISQGDIIRNTRKQRDQIKEERDWLKEDKKKLEHAIGDLLKAGHSNKDKLEKIKTILDE